MVPTQSSSVSPAEAQPQTPQPAAQPQPQPQSPAQPEVQNQPAVSAHVPSEAQASQAQSSKPQQQCQPQSSVQGQSPVRVQSPPLTRIRPSTPSQVTPAQQPQVQTTTSQPVPIPPPTSLQTPSQGQPQPQPQVQSSTQTLSQVTGSSPSYPQLQRVQVLSQTRAQQGAVPQQIQLQLPIPVEHSSAVQTQQTRSVVTVQAASVQEHLQRVQHLREQQPKQQQPKQIAVERGHTLHASDQREAFRNRESQGVKAACSVARIMCCAVDLVLWLW